MDLVIGPGYYEGLILPGDFVYQIAVERASNQIFHLLNNDAKVLLHWNCSPEQLRYNFSASPIFMTLTGKGINWNNPNIQTSTREAIVNVASKLF